MENQKAKKSDKFFSGRGFYIVLALCVAVIGISALSIAGNSGAEPELDPGLKLSATEEPVQSIEPVISTVEPEPVDIPDDDGAVVSTFKSGEGVENEKLVWIAPVDGEFERLYCVETLSYDVTMRDWRTHDGVDILAQEGSLVRAAAKGTVESVEGDALYGMTVVIDHGSGIKSVYSNLAETPTVKIGDSVKAGDVIGSVGATAKCEIGQGSHLHFAMSESGTSVDPAKYLPKEKN